MSVEFVSIEIYDDDLTSVEINETGSQGVSAYGIAVANGFVGTEAEWLESLNGPNLITPETDTTIEGILVGDAGAVREALPGEVIGSTELLAATSTLVDTTDPRLSDARTPLPHTHGNISNAGAIGSIANLPVITDAGGVLTTGSFGSSANTFCQGNDSRLSDARTPTAHTHQWTDITSTPTTLAGYGITDAVDTTDPRLADAREWTAVTMSQAEAEAGTATTRRAVTAERMRQAIVAYLAPLRPVVLTQPTAASGNVGDSLSISCLGGILPNSHLNLTYQWQLSTDAGVSYNNITGATSPTIPFDPALFANNGLYRCRLTNAFGSQDTNAVALTIDNSIRHLYGVNDRGVAWDLDRMDHLFQVSTGATPVTAYGDPVGLILTRERGGLDSLGSELVNNGSFDSAASWTLGTGWAIGSGLASKTSGTASNLTQTVSLVAGRTYQVVYTVTHTAGVFRPIFIGGTLVNGVARNTSGTFVEYITAVAGNTTFGISADSSASGSIDNVSIREVPGSHWVQTTSSRRPTYARRPKSGIRNLLQRTEEIANAYWIKNAVSLVGSTTTPTGIVLSEVREDTTNDRHRVLTVNVNRQSGITYTTSCFVKLGAGTRFFILNANTLHAARASFDLTNGTISNIIGSAAIEDLGNGLFRCSVTGTATATGTTSVFLQLQQTANDVPYIGDGVSSLYMGGVQLEAGSVATAYQRVGNQFDVTETGQPSINYLWCDGIDDCMQSASAIDWTTDEVTACLSQRKMTDASQRTLLEFGPSLDLNNQSWQLTAPNSAAANYAARSRGTGIANAIASGFAAPDLAVLTMQSKIGTDLLTLRRNKVEVASSTDDQGGGNYGNVVINLGSRNQASQFYQGHINSGFVINRLLNPLILADYERYWVAQKAGIDL